MLLRSPRNVPPHNGERSEELRGALRDDPNNAGCEVRDAFLPGTRDEPLTTSAWEARNRPTLRELIR